MKMNHISLPTHNPLAEAQFFVDHFGARIEFTAPNGSVLLKHGEMDIVLDAVESPVWHRDFHFGIELPRLSDVSALYAKFKAAGVHLESEIFNRMGRGSRFFGRTPGGVQFEINTREDKAVSPSLSSRGAATKD